MRDSDPTIQGILTQCQALLEEMDDLLLGIEPMSPEEVRRAAKLPREGGDTVVGELATQCRAIDLLQADRETTVAGMLEALHDARAFRAVIDRHELVLARLRAARVRAESESWRSAMTFYAVLRRTAAREASVKAGLEPVREFFRRGRAGRPSPRAPMRGTCSATS
jgi:hypothetical protein